MKCLPVLLCFLLVSISESLSHLGPHFSFLGQNLPDNSYADISSLGERSESECLQCLTSLSTCCSAQHGSHRGDWFFPNGSKLPFQGEIYQHRSDRMVILCRSNSGSLEATGIYRCDIQLTDSEKKSVHVGLYGSAGITICFLKYHCSSMIVMYCRATLLFPIERLKNRKVLN